MSENVDLMQGIRLRDHVKRVCRKCKINVDPATVVCPRCQKTLPAPIVLPTFRQAVEAVLHFALAGQLNINSRGEVDEVLKQILKLAAYLIWAATVAGLEATIAFGFPRLFSECDTQGNLFPDLIASLRATRAFLDEQQALATKILARLRQEPTTNNLESLVNEYQDVFTKYAAEQEKTGGKPTSALEAVGKQLSGILAKVDSLVQLLGPSGGLWALQDESLHPCKDTFAGAEWSAFLSVISNLANFTLKISNTTNLGG